MTCPFGFSSLRQAQLLDKELQERDGVPSSSSSGGASNASSPAAPSSSLPSSHGSPAPVQVPNGAVLGHSEAISPPLVNKPGGSKMPLSLFTGGLRTSLGVENAHPISVWMKEIQARGGLKGIDIEKELLGFEGTGVLQTADGEAHPSQLDELDEIARAQQAKNWKEKRERPPVEVSAAAAAAAAANPGANMITGLGNNPTHPADLHHFPGMFNMKINHNSHAGQNPMTKYDQEITYWNYIHPEVLTSLQNGRQGKGLNNPDEHLFILVHQTFELWFKQILWELEYVRNVMIGYRDPHLPKEPREFNPLGRCVQRLERSDKILRLATEGYAIMETMDPADFLEFRDFLSPSSGFQSVQLREMEILLGLKDEERLACAGRHYREAFMANGDDKTPIFDHRLREHTLKDGLYIWLRRHVPTTRLDQFLDAYFKVINTQNSEKSKDFEEELALLDKMAARTKDPKELSYLKDLSEKAKFGRQLARNSSDDVRLFFADPLLGVQRSAILFLFTYHTHPSFKEAAALINGFLKFEQAVLLWRSRHARMVEMFIGRRPGTGGSSGVEYIDQTAAQYRIFTDIWRIRSLCVAASKLDFDPTDGAAVFGTEVYCEDIQQVEAGIQAETQRIKDQAAAKAKATKAAAKANGVPPAAAQTVNVTADAGGSLVLPASAAAAIAHHAQGAPAPSEAAAAGELANSSTSIAAGVGPGVAPGHSAF